jgi:hypothetical protein
LAIPQCLGCGSLWKQGQEPGAFYRDSNHPLMGGASAGLFFGFDLSHSGSEMLQSFGVLEINFLNVFLAKIASHMGALRNFQFSIFNFQTKCIAFV